MKYRIIASILFLAILAALAIYYFSPQHPSADSANSKSDEVFRNLKIP
jgi:hypothetical protein